MLELAFSQLQNAKTLFESLEIHLASQAILAGVTTGQAWVDDLLEPGVGMLAHGFRHYLAGAVDNTVFNQGLCDYFLGPLRSTALASHVGGSLIYFDSPAWQPVLVGLFQEIGCRFFERQYYETQARLANQKSLLPAGFKPRQVEAALLADPNLRGLDELREEMCSERDSVAEFLEKSFGICIVRAGPGNNPHQLAGWCLSEYNLGERCEIGIATMEPYQRRGLATAAALAFLDQAHQRGYRRIGWHCYTDNIASVAAALKAGLAKVTDYQVCYLPLG